MAKTSWSQKETGVAIAQIRKRVDHAQIEHFGCNGKQCLVPCPDKDGPAGSKVGNCAFDIHAGLIGEETYTRGRVCHKITFPRDE
jgi:hypothetical protein